MQTLNVEIGVEKSNLSPGCASVKEKKWLEFLEKKPLLLKQTILRCFVVRVQPPCLLGTLSTLIFDSSELKILSHPQSFFGGLS